MFHYAAITTIAKTGTKMCFGKREDFSSTKSLKILSKMHKICEIVTSSFFHMPF